MIAYLVIGWPIAAIFAWLIYLAIKYTYIHFRSQREEHRRVA